MPPPSAHRVKSCCLILMLAFELTAVRLAEAQNGLDVTIHAHFGRASQIIVPQSRGFFIDHRAVEQRGQAIVIESVEARVKILERTASTTLEIRLRNPSPQQGEAIVLLPAPDGAVVSGFLFEGATSEPTAQVLPKDEARRLYDAIVAKARDPALLEFAGYNLIRSSVFPVAGGGTQKVRLTYEHLLSADGQRVDYILPRSESLDRRNPWRISVDIASRAPISTVYSPSHEILTERRAPGHLSVKLVEASSLDPGPFRLSYLLENNGVSASMFAYPDPKVGGGYFLLMAGLPASIADAPNPIKREVTVVIDRSGSMAGEKMDQAKAAALQVIEGLADGEAFNIIEYSTTVSQFAARPVVKDATSRAQARQYIRAIGPSGGTNIHDALVESLRPDPLPGTLPIVLFLTDGLPTVGQTSEVAIGAVVEKGNPHQRRVFAFGVGNDVNVPLLDRIADLTRATTTYVLPHEDVEVKVAAVFKRLYGPVFKDIQIATANGEPSTRLVRELIPHTIPDLYEGDQLILLGQYQQSGPITFTLKGNFLGTDRTFTFSFNFDAATTKNAFVPRLWASRRIAYLVDQIRQAGAQSAGRPLALNESFNQPQFRELTDEILRLSTEFGILTEYTAFLATEGTNLSDWESLRAACGTTLDNRAVRTRSGQAAVNQGINFNFQKAKGSFNPNGNCYVDQNLNRVEITNVQQVCDRAFFKRRDHWIDAQLVTPGGRQEIAHDAVVHYGSPEHLNMLHQLVAENRQGVLSLEGDIILRFHGRTILVKNAAP